MKKKLFVLSVLAIILAGMVTGTLAYYTAKGVAHNVITTGEIDIALVEKQDLDNNPATPETDYPTDSVTGLMPGQEHSKIVRIANTGTNPAWVRMEVVVSVTGEDGKALADDQLHIDFDTEHWEKKADGLYYYKAKLDPGASTEPLFRTVEFRSSMGDAYQNAQISIDVKADGIQYQNNTEYASAWPTGVEILEKIF